MKTIDKKSYEQRLEDNVEKLQEMLRETEIGNCIKELKESLEKRVDAINERLFQLEVLLENIDLDRLSDIVEDSKLDILERNIIHERIQDLEKFVSGVVKVKKMSHQAMDDVLNNCGFNYGSKTQYNEYRTYTI